MTDEKKLNPVRSVTLQDSVYHELFQAIVNGRLEPGERLGLEATAKMLGVSIMPVREAIRKLEAGSLVTVRNRRIVVNRLSPKKIREIVQVRLILEGYAASRAARVRSDDVLPLLEGMLGVMNRTDDVEEFLKAHRNFHRTIYNECDNSSLMEMIDSLWERFSPYLHILLYNLADWKEPHITRLHEEMFKRLREKDSAGVKKWIKRDLRLAGKRVLRTLKLSEPAGD